VVRLIAVTTCLVLINRLAVNALYWVFSVAGTFTLRKLDPQNPKTPYAA
jgi:hypothetical protein